MSTGHHVDREQTFALAKRANELMLDYGASATPRAYTLWYTYVAGTLPPLNDAIKRLTTKNGTLTNADIDELYETHIDGRRLSAQAEKANLGLIAEIESMMELLDLSLGATAQYGASLQAFSDDLTGPVMSRQRLREIVSELIANTQEVAANNLTRGKSQIKKNSMNKFKLQAPQ